MFFLAQNFCHPERDEKVSLIVFPQFFEEMQCRAPTLLSEDAIYHSESLNSDFQLMIDLAS